MIHAFVRPRTIPRSSQRDIWRQVGNSNALMRVLIRWSVESATTVDSYAGHLKGRMDVIWRILQSVMRNPAASFDLGDLIMDALNQQHASDGRADWSPNGPPVSRNTAAAEVIGLLFHTCHQLDRTWRT